MGRGSRSKVGEGRATGVKGGGQQDGDDTHCTRCVGHCNVRRRICRGRIETRASSPSYDGTTAPRPPPPGPGEPHRSAGSPALPTAAQRAGARGAGRSQQCAAPPRQMGWTACCSRLGSSCRAGRCPRQALCLRHRHLPGGGNDTGRESARWVRLEGVQVIAVLLNMYLAVRSYVLTLRAGVCEDKHVPAVSLMARHRTRSTSGVRG